MVYRIYVEKKPGFDVEAEGLRNELVSLLGIKKLSGLRLLNRYDVEGIDEALFTQCVSTVFSEPPVDRTYSELPAAGKPAILIPSPYVAEDHQRYNAMALVDKGAARCLEEKDLTADSLWALIGELTASPDTLRSMGERAKSAAVPDAAERIYRAIRRVVSDAK